MEANELRLGNLVTATLTNEIYEIGIWALRVIEDGNYQNSYDTETKVYEPIPLTEEWLLKFGFEKNNNNQFILMEGSVDILFNKDLNGWTCDGINFSINMTEHVHQLQNLYFALTGEELTFKSE